MGRGARPARIAAAARRGSSPPAPGQERIDAWNALLDRYRAGDPVPLIFELYVTSAQAGDADLQRAAGHIAGQLALDAVDYGDCLPMIATVGLGHAGDPEHYALLDDAQERASAQLCDAIVDAVTWKSGTLNYDVIARGDLPDGFFGQEVDELQALVEDAARDGLVEAAAQRASADPIACLLCLTGLREVSELQRYFRRQLAAADLPEIDTLLLNDPTAWRQAAAHGSPDSPTLTAHLIIRDCLRRQRRRAAQQAANERAANERRRAHRLAARIAPPSR